MTQIGNALALVAKAIGDDAENIAQSIDLDGLRLLVDPTADILAQVSAESATLTLARFGADVTTEMFEQVNLRSVNVARDRAAELVGMRRLADGTLIENPNAQYRIDESTRNMIRRTITAGLEAGDENLVIAKRIEEIGFGKVRSELIAFTEIRRAHVDGTLQGLHAATTLNIGVKKHWSTARDDKVCEPICMENEAVGDIPLDKTFPSGDLGPPGHPRCRCRLVGVVE